MEHHFNIELAAQFGILEAVLLNHMQFWIKRNAANGINSHDGAYWTYNSVKAYSELFPYASEKQIRSALKKLVELGILKTGNYNKLAYDRTLWYAFTEKGLSICPLGKMEMPKKENGNAQEGEPIPDNYSYDKPTNKPNIKDTRHKYGEYKNVLLTDEQLEQLKAEFPQDWQKRIEKVSAYSASTGKTYKNYLATIRNWANRDNEKKKQDDDRFYKSEEVEDDLPF